MTLSGRLAWGAYAAGSALAAPFFARKDAARLAAQDVAQARIAERLGHATEPRPEGRLVWLHAVSVGEAQSVLGLAERLGRETSVLVTTTSATSARIVASRLPAGARHQFAPLDAPGAVRRFLDHWRPDLMVLAESELWPRQIVRAAARDIPVALVNARLSDRTLARWRRAAPLARHVLSRLSLVRAQDARTADGLVALGLPSERIAVTGTLKSAALPLLADEQELRHIRAAVADRPLWLAASTHPGEEEQVSEAHRQLCQQSPELLLILVPRHPERGGEVAARLREAGWTVARRATGEAMTPETEIYLADTLGELGLWYRLARVAFIGGSLEPVGGHNPIEAVQLGCHAVTGPHIVNFADIYKELADAGMAQVLGSAAELPAAIDRTRTAAPAAMPAGALPSVETIARDLLSLIDRPRARDPIVLAPNFKRRLSGVTATVVRLVPLQARAIAICATGPVLPDHVPQIPLSSLPFLDRRVARVWHARRNVEMLGGLALKHLLRKNLRLLFTSASQRQHTGLTRWLIRRMDAVVATSAKTASYLEVPAQVIRHGIDTEAFAPDADRAALRQRLGLPGDATLVGCYGRIRSSKGTDLFVDAMLEVLADRPSVTAIVMGRAVAKDRAFADSLAMRAGQAGLADRLLFLPEVSVGAMPDWYAALDLHVAPQRWEGFGLTPLEAMASAVPVVATKVGAFEELVAHGTTGLLVEPDSADALATAISALLDAPESLREMGLAAREHVARDFTLQGEADALTALYRELLSR